MGLTPTRMVILFFFASLLVQAFKLYQTVQEEGQSITPQFKDDEANLDAVQDIQNQGLEEKDIETIDIRADKGIHSNSQFHSDEDIVRIHVKYCIG